MPRHHENDGSPGLFPFRGGQQEPRNEGQKHVQQQGGEGVKQHAHAVRRGRLWKKKHKTTAVEYVRIFALLGGDLFGRICVLRATRSYLPILLSRKSTPCRRVFNTRATTPPPPPALHLSSYRPHGPQDPLGKRGEPRPCSRKAPRPQRLCNVPPPVLLLLLLLSRRRTERRQSWWQEGVSPSRPPLPLLSSLAVPAMFSSRRRGGRWSRRRGDARGRKRARAGGGGSVGGGWRRTGRPVAVVRLLRPPRRFLVTVTVVAVVAVAVVYLLPTRRPTPAATPGTTV